MESLMLLGVFVIWLAMMKTGSAADAVNADSKVSPKKARASFLFIMRAFTLRRRHCHVESNERRKHCIRRSRCPAINLDSSSSVFRAFRRIREKSRQRRRDAGQSV